MDCEGDLIVYSLSLFAYLLLKRWSFLIMNESIAYAINWLAITQLLKPRTPLDSTFQFNWSPPVSPASLWSAYSTIPSFPRHPHHDWTNRSPLSTPHTRPTPPMRTPPTRPLETLSTRQPSWRCTPNIYGGLTILWWCSCRSSWRGRLLGLCRGWRGTGWGWSRSGNRIRGSRILLLGCRCWKRGWAAPPQTDCPTTPPT